MIIKFLLLLVIWFFLALAYNFKFSKGIIFSLSRTCFIIIFYITDLLVFLKSFLLSKADGQYLFIYLEGLTKCFTVGLVIFFAVNIFKLKLPTISFKKSFIPFVFFIIYFLIFSFLSVKKHYNFYTHSYDLGVYGQAIYNTVLGFPFDTSLRGHNFNGDHQIPILFFLVPLFYIFKNAVCLLILQSCIIGLTFFPLYSFAKEKLNENWAIIFCFLFFLYPPLHYINLFDFHPDAFLILFLFLAYYYLDKNNFSLSFLFLMLSIYCKEQVALLGIIFSFFYFFKLKKKTPAVIVLLFSLVWLYLTLFVIAPYFNPKGFLYFTMYNYLGKSFSAKIFTIIFKPYIPLKEIFVFTKIGSLVLFLSPLFFLPLFSPAVFIFALPTLLVNHLSNDIKVSSIFFQHSAAVIPFYFISSVLAIKYLIKKFADFNNSLLFAILIFNLAFSYYFGALPFSKQFLNKNYTLGDFRSLKFNKEVYFPDSAQIKHLKIIYRAINLIPQDKNISVCTQGHIFPQIMFRRFTYEFPDLHNVDYVIIDKKGNTWPFAKENFYLYLRAVADLSKNINYINIFNEDGVLVFKRKYAAQ